MLRNSVTMKDFQKRIHHFNRECTIVLKKRAQCVDLVPGSAAQYPLSWVLEGIENVVHMDSYSAGQSWENLEKQKVDVTSGFADMR